VIGFQCWSVAFLLRSHSGFSLASEMELGKTRMGCAPVVVREGRISDDRNRRRARSSCVSQQGAVPYGGRQGGCPRALFARAPRDAWLPGERFEYC